MSNPVIDRMLEDGILTARELQKEVDHNRKRLKIVEAELRDHKLYVAQTGISELPALKNKVLDQNTELTKFSCLINDIPALKKKVSEHDSILSKIDTQNFFINSKLDSMSASITEISTHFHEQRGVKKFRSVLTSGAYGFAGACGALEIYHPLVAYVTNLLKSFGWAT